MRPPHSTSAFVLLLCLLGAPAGAAPDADRVPAPEIRAPEGLASRLESNAATVASRVVDERMADALAGLRGRPASRDAHAPKPTAREDQRTRMRCTTGPSGRLDCKVILEHIDPETSSDAERPTAAAN